jgi:ERF superfamily
MTELIYAKMLEAQRLFGKGGIEKKDRNKFQNFNYRSVDSTIAAASAVFSSVGIFCVPDSPQVEWLTKEGKDKSGNPRMDYTLRATFTFTFYAEDGSFVKAAAIPVANTAQDDSKLLGQCLSYAYKEVLFKTFSIPVEGVEDIDSLDTERNQPPHRPKLTPHEMELLEEIEGMQPHYFPQPPEATKRWLAKRDSKAVVAPIAPDCASDDSELPF